MIINKDNAGKSFKEVTVFENEKIMKLLNTEISDFLLNNERTGILFYPVPLEIKSSPLMQKFDSIDDILPQTIYVYDQLEGKYIELTKFLENNLIKKIKYIATICGYCGAKKVEITHIVYKTSNQNYNLSLDGKAQIFTYTDINFTGNRISSIIENINQKISLKEEFIGQRKIDKAIEIAKKFGLAKDPVIEDLLENSEFKKTMEINIDLFSEIKKTVQTCATLELDLNFIQSEFKIYADLKKEINQTKGLTYKMFIEF